MKRTIKYGALSKPTDQEALIRILACCYSSAPAPWDTYFARVGLENLRIVRLERQVAGGLAIYFMGQWFGGRSVPTGGIAAVGVAPELRGAGVAFELMARTLSELHESGIPLSTLYASTQSLYRKLGYEQAGSRCQLTMPTRAIRIADRSLTLKAVDPSRHELFHDLYRERARKASGHLDRTKAIWERVVLRREPEQAVHAYIAGQEGQEGQEEGYVVFTQPEREGGGYDLMVRDLVALTPGAARRLWSLLADHRSLARDVLWCGPAADPLACLLPEQDPRVKYIERWMMRVVDVPKALAMRGYPEGVEGELHLEVSDDLLSANQGRWVLQVAEGRGEVRSGGSGALKLAVSGLAPLYSGFLTALELASIGFLSGPQPVLAASARLFAGPEPWMPDAF